MSQNQKLKTWRRQEAPKLSVRAGKVGTSGKKKPPSPAPQSPVEGYWQEWTPEDALPNVGYCTQLYLPPGAFLVHGAVSVRLADAAPGPSEVECSLFVDEENRFLTQIVLAPGEAESIAATTHVESTEPTEIQWNCGGTSAPFRLQLAVNAITVHRLHHVGTPPGV